MRADLADQPTFEDLVGRMRQTVAEAAGTPGFPRSQRCRFNASSPIATHPSRSPIFQAMFLYQKAQRLEDEGLHWVRPGRIGSAAHALAGLELEGLARRSRDRPLRPFPFGREGVGRLHRPEPRIRHRPLPCGQHRQDARPVRRTAGGNRRGPRPEGRRSPDPDRITTTTPDRRMERRLRQAPPPRELLHPRVEEHARRAPETLAVVAEDERLTYAVLNARAEALALRLRQLGVGPEVRVAISVERSPWMLVGVLGGLEGGRSLRADRRRVSDGAKVARDRRLWRASVVLTQGHLADELGAAKARIVLLDTDDQPSPAGTAQALRRSARKPGVHHLHLRQHGDAEGSGRLARLDG